MRIDPFGGDTVRLHNMTPAFRRRVGSYRILFDIYTAERLVEVHDIRRRSEKTYRKKK
jgi:mRNA-degrading endonuclease RelE of RelBE toxin-antitoxin system